MRWTYGNNLGSNEGERSLGHDSPPSQELALDPSNAIVLHERPRVLPVPEADPVVVRPPTEVEYDSENDEADDGDDLDGREDELALAVHARAEHVDDHDDDKEDRDPCGVETRVFVPVVDEHGGSAEFGWE